MQWLNLRVQSNLTSPRHHTLAGVFVQYELLPEGAPYRRLRLYPEAGIHRGNYRTCGDFDPYPAPGLWYASLGGSLSVQVSRRIQAELGFYNYQIINNIPDKYNYTQYIAGLEYLLFVGK
ncbi:MAG: hypothetical protein OHK0039_12960 [Bacteroidia bacterium]